MTGDSRQKLADIASELNAGRAVHYVAMTRAGEATIRDILAHTVEPEAFALFTTSNTEDTSPPRTPNKEGT